MIADKEYYESILDTVSDGIWVSDTDDRITYCNRAMERIAGVGADRIVGRVVTTDFPEETTGQLLPHYGQARESLKPVTYEIGVVTPGGRSTLQVGVLTPLVAEGVFVGMICSITEVTDGEQLERDYEALFRGMLEGFALHRIVCNEQGEAVDYRFLAVNPAFEMITGLKGADIVGRTVLEILPDLEMHWISTYGKVALSGEPSVFEDYSAPLDKHFMVSAFSPAPGTFACLFVDISQRCKAEENQRIMESQLRQSQKLESIGTLASGVAHEINNPIMGIMGYAQIIADRLDPESPLMECATEIGKETDRIAKIVKNLLSFARHDKQQHSPARVCDIVAATLSLIGTVLRHDQIRIDLHIAEDLPHVRCRSQQIQQVLMNLLTNARDALNEKYPGQDDNKVVAVSAECGCWNAEGQWESEPIPDGGMRSRGASSVHSTIRIIVEDHGSGIPDAVCKRIFDPFFTTKPHDRGTGLGLSISHGIVKEHHGVMSVESRPGQGTRFLVELPLDNGWSVE